MHRLREGLSSPWARAYYAGSTIQEGTDPMLLNYLNDTIFRVNMAIDEGRKTSLEDAHRHLAAGDVFEWLSAEHGCDFSIILSDSMKNEKQAITQALRQSANARKGDERGKLGVSNNGLCLIIGLVLDVISSEKISTEYYKNFSR